jgi:hypothetical protein
MSVPRVGPPPPPSLQRCSVVVRVRIIVVTDSVFPITLHPLSIKGRVRVSCNSKNNNHKNTRCRVIILWDVRTCLKCHVSFCVALDLRSCEHPYKNSLSQTLTHNIYFEAIIISTYQTLAHGYQTINAIEDMMHLIYSKDSTIYINLATWI